MHDGLSELRAQVVDRLLRAGVSCGLNYQPGALGELMDLKAGVETASKWAATSYELHAAAANWSEELDRKVKREIAAMNLTAKDWDGDAPFTAFQNPQIPGPFSYSGDGLVQRVLFKVELWSAPDVGGIVRAYFSDDQTGWTTKPRLVIDFANVGGSPRLVAMHRTCPRCKTTAIGKTGGLCDYETRRGVPCMDGLLFGGGLAFDRGVLRGSERLVQPDARWAALMER